MGILTRAQAHRDGISDTQLQRAVKCGELHRIAAGIYMRADYFPRTRCASRSPAHRSRRCCGLRTRRNPQPCIRGSDARSRLRSSGPRYCPCHAE
ncbi:type IV toxin-antitoxin system AbiEi family antitoxin domain-containing protein [Rhodococcus sp. NPDC056743]|uniref:type IV toxin-antitoxin system AbiEi family antitoxin domain-containing protein n=1 Tax=Rhodococcus sp. NPDC056743 TaxID=3345934 RepID=UPI0036716CBE